MPGKSGTEMRVRTVVLTTRWSADEHRRLNEIAEYSNCSRAEVLRRLVQQGHTMILPSKLLVAEIRRIGFSISNLAGDSGGSKQENLDSLNDVYRDLLSVTRKLLQ